MPIKKDEPASRAKNGASIDESSPVIENTSQVETWTVPAKGMTGEIPAAVETWTIPGRDLTGEIIGQDLNKPAGK